MTILRLTTGTPVLLRQRNFGAGGASQITFAPDGSIAVGRDGGTVEFYALAEFIEGGEIVPTAVFPGDDGFITSIAFSADGDLMTVGHDAGYLAARDSPFYATGATALWDVPTETLLGGAFGPGSRTRSISPDGSRLLVASDDGVRIRNLDADFWAQQACHAAGRNLTREEWAEFFPILEYQATCPQWPIERSPHRSSGATVFEPGPHDHA